MDQSFLAIIRRTLLDTELLFTHYLTSDWIFVALGGIAFGLLVAKSMWYQPLPELLKITPEPDEEEQQDTEPEQEIIDTEFEVIEEDVEIVASEPIKEEKPTERSQITTPPVKVVEEKEPEVEVTPDPEPEPEEQPQPNALKSKTPVVDVEETESAFFEDEGGGISTAPQRIVFIMDVSFSLTPTQFALSKSELKSAIKNLHENASYQVIFFAGGARFAHQAESEEYRKGDELPVGKWLRANTRNKNRTIRSIDQVGKSRGTTWVLPLELAMNMELFPDSIFFHTDGEKKQHAELAKEIKKLIRKRGPVTKVHTIALMSANSQSTRSLKAIADGTGGNFKLVARK